MIRVVTAVFRATDGIQMQCKNRNQTKRWHRPLAVACDRGVLEQDQPHAGVDRPGDFDDVRVHLAGIKTHCAVFHVKAAVK